METNEDFKKFVKIIKDYPMLNEKSMLPEKRKQRQKAINEIKVKIEQELKATLTDSQILKKFHNMKTRIKKKTNKNQTGNKKIILKDWEDDLLKFMLGESNPTVVKVKGAVAASDSEDVDEAYPVLPSISKKQNKSNPKKKKFEESKETSGLTTIELQRLVLLHQLEYFKKAEKLVDLQINEHQQRLKLLMNLNSEPQVYTDL